MERSKPPPDISPHEFFTRWVPQAVATDPERRRRLSDTDATIVFDLEPSASEGSCESFSVRIRSGEVTGRAGHSDAPDLRVRVDLETWRQLNAGAISAPQALLKRRVKLEGDFLLGLKLHLILG